MNKLVIGAMLAAGVVLPTIGVAPQLQARTLGKEYVVRVAPVDPIDPFRGAYVDLSYPDLRKPNLDPGIGDGSGETTIDGGMGSMPDNKRGDVFITLKKQGEVWVADKHQRERPDKGPYLACTNTDWRIECGVESWFAPQGKAREIEKQLADKGALATLKIDSRGNAAVVGLR